MKDAPQYPDGYFDTFQSPFSYRYGSDAMRGIWSEQHKMVLMAKLYTAGARALMHAGLATDKEVADLESHIGSVDFRRVMEIEKTTKHDVNAMIKALAEQSPVGRRIIGQATTSEDMTSNVDMVRNLESLPLIKVLLEKTLLGFAGRTEQYADVVCMGYTHMQPAVPTTVGYRLARYGQNFLIDYQGLEFVTSVLRAKGMKGAVGTSASFTAMLQGRGITPRQFEAMIMEEMGLEPALITGQVYPRKFDILIAQALSNIGSSSVEFGNNFRLMQSPVMGEWAEPVLPGQVGSNAMPWKRNPINIENSMSLGGGLEGVAVNAQSVASRQVLERGLDDSADRRVTSPEMFFRAEEALTRVHRVISTFGINQVAINRNLDRFAPFVAIEKVLLLAVAVGADRVETHEHLRDIALQAWTEIDKGKKNPLETMITKDQTLLHLGLTPRQLKQVFGEVRGHVGDAPERSRDFVNLVRKTCK